MPKRARFIFFLRALHKMTDICNFLDGSIPVNLEREVLIYVSQKRESKTVFPRLEPFSLLRW